MTTNTAESIHGHEVMHLILEQGPLSRAALASKVSQLFGSDARFHTCSAQGMNLNALLDFLTQRSKVNEGPQGLYMQGAEAICSNE